MAWGNKVYTCGHTLPVHGKSVRRGATLQSEEICLKCQTIVKIVCDTDGHMKNPPWNHIEKAQGDNPVTYRISFEPKAEISFRVISSVHTDEISEDERVCGLCKELYYYRKRIIQWEQNLYTITVNITNENNVLIGDFTMIIKQILDRDSHFSRFTAESIVENRKETLPPPAPVIITDLPVGNDWELLLGETESKPDKPATLESLASKWGARVK